ncbi:Pumilio 3 [Nymphon striatum]|nr:Pumilio 3 [Nymphon striatum]
MKRKAQANSDKNVVETKVNKEVKQVSPQKENNPHPVNGKKKKQKKRGKKTDKQSPKVSIIEVSEKMDTEDVTKEVETKVNEELQTDGTSNEGNKKSLKSTAKKRKLPNDGGPDSSKIKLEQLSFKDRKTERKKKFKNNFDVSMRAKKIWETLIFAHDTVRVMECLVALGTSSHRDKLFLELKDHIIPLSKSKYAKFFVLKMLKYGSKDQKNLIMKEFQGQIVKLIKHTEAASVIECAYNECANATQRSSMMVEFYGPDFALFKDDTIKSLADVLAKDPSRKDSIIKHMKESLLNLIEKSVVKHSIVHRALREFITNADATSRSDLIEVSREVVVQVLHTKDGSRFAMHCLWHGTPKDRKAIIKSLKTHIKKICEEEDGHLVLLALFDCVDDTKIVEKIVIQEIIKNLRDISNNVYGRKVLQYLLSPRDKHFFHPDIVSLLALGDGNKYSKKDPNIKRKELLKASSEMLLILVEDRSEDLLKANPLCMLMLAILQYASGSLEKAYKSIVKCLSEPYEQSSKEFCHPIESSSGNFLLKKLILLDKEKHKSGNSEIFLKSLIDNLPEKSLSKWIHCNRGAFLVLTMLETEIDFVVKYVKEELSTCKRTLKQKDYKGASLLLSKL